MAGKVNVPKTVQNAAEAAAKANDANVPDFLAEAEAGEPIEGLDTPAKPNIIDQTKDKVKELTTKVTDNIPAGIRSTASNVLGLNSDGILGQTVGELDTLTENISGALDVVTGRQPLSSLAGFVRPGDSAQSVIDGAAKGYMRTFTFPEDFSQELCFRLDFLKFDRSNVFTPQKAEPVSTFVFPLPKSIGVQQGVSYSSQELGSFGEAEARIRGDQKTNTNDIGELASAVAKGAAGQVGSTLFRTALNTDVGRVGSLAVGFIPNPHLANIFTGVGLRTFKFDVVFAPRNARESDNLQHILDHIRSYILPAMSDNFVTLDYPHEVAISFSAGGSSLVSGSQGKTPLDRIFNFKRCVCTDISIDINGQAGTQAYFKDQAPTEVTVGFSFSETQIQVANDYGHKAKAVGSQDLLDGALSLFDETTKKVSDTVSDATQRQENR